MCRIFLMNAYFQEFSQKHVGWQLLPAQIFTASDIPLKHIDFSHNSMRRLAERLFDGEQFVCLLFGQNFMIEAFLIHEYEVVKEGRVK